MMRAAIVMFLVACGGGEQATPATSSSSAPPPATSSATVMASASASAAVLPPEIQAKQAAADFLKALSGKTDALGMSDLKRFDAKTDPNELLGRPNQYVEKLSWKVAGDDGTVEFFVALEDANKRAETIRKAGKEMPMLLQWVYVNEKRLAVLRLPHKVTPDDAKKWEAILAGI